MPEFSGWTPDKGTHAIQMAGVFVTFTEPVGDVLWRRAEKIVSPLADKMGLLERDRANIPPQVAALVENIPGAMIPDLGTVYRRRENPQVVLEGFRLARNDLRYDSWEYTRWAPFLARARMLMFPALDLYLQVAPLNQIATEYVDVFRWKGDTDPDVEKVIRQGSELVAPIAGKRGALWHSHAGWFDSPVKQTPRTLIEVRASVRSDPSRPGKYYLRLQTRFEDQFRRPGMQPFPDEEATATYVESRLEAQHLRMKEILTMILTDEAAAAVSLK